MVICASLTFLNKCNLFPSISSLARSCSKNSDLYGTWKIVCANFSLGLILQDEGTTKATFKPETQKS